MKATLQRVRGGASWIIALGILVAPAIFVSAEDNHVSDVYQFNINPYHPVADRLDMFGNLGCYQNSDYSEYRFGWPGLIYHVESWLQLWGGLDAYYTDNDHSPDQLELRPFAGAKIFVPNQAKLLLYNFTRYEYRAFENEESGTWSNYSRIRSRFGAEIPLTSRTSAWTEKTFYALADVEPFYRFDKNEWDPVQLRGGLGYIVNKRIRLELIYTGQFTRSSADRSFQHSENLIELNLKLALHEGILARVFNPGD
ncbi:MAG TPA: DUF2490 domain-containing protein [bacterium]|nr:DUF2490 domain-containing protein [bacterium]